jgi:hypothetical protein
LENQSVYGTNIWKPLQIWGVSDPTSPAKNYMESKMNSASKNGLKITVVK